MFNNDFDREFKNFDRMFVGFGCLAFIGQVVGILFLIIMIVGMGHYWGLW